MTKLKSFLPIILLISIMGLKLLPYNDPIQKSTNSLAIENHSESVPNSTSDVKVEITSLGNMKASWYGPRFHGRLTANGEIYDQNGFTAAHKDLPFGTLLRLTNLVNDKSVVVRINDRGPYIPGRQIDLSKRVALELGSFNLGVVKLKVEKIELTGITAPIIN